MREVAVDDYGPFAGKHVGQGMRVDGVQLTEEHLHGGQYAWRESGVDGGASRHPVDVRVAQFAEAASIKQTGHGQRERQRTYPSENGALPCRMRRVARQSS